MDIELTSTGEDGWTWRAAGARQPRGTVDASLVPSGSAVGDVLRVETEQFVDGITVTAVLPPKGARPEAQLLEIFTRDDGPLVTSTLAPKRGRGDRRRDDREDRGERRRDGRGRQRDGERSRDGRGRQRDGERSRGRGRSDAADKRRGGGKDRPRRDTPPAPPRPKRLRPRHVHRDAAIKALPAEQHRLGRILARSGVPGLRDEIAAQNKAAAAAGEPEIPVELLLKVAERIHQPLRTADWRDRAEAALAGVADVDLRDLRSVVVAAETGAKDDDARQLAEQLRTELAARVDREHAEWLAEVASTLGDGRVVRALRLSSRPPKAGAPLPGDMLAKLAEAAGASLTTETGQDRWGTVLDAVALSPVRERVVPLGIPAEPGEDLKALVTRVSTLVPAIAAQFGIEPTAPPRNRRRGGRRS